MKGKIAVGAVIGALAGVAAGMLTAPKSGKETRADLKTKADELKNQAAKTSRRVVETAEQKSAKVADKVQGAVENAKQGLKK